MEACDPKASSVGFDEEDGEDVSSSAEELDYDDSEEDPTYDVLEETFSKLSTLSLKKSKSRNSKTIGLARKLELDDAEIKAPEELNETDKKCFKKVEEIIKADGLQKLTVEQCKVYLRKHGLRLTGKKDILIERIREHLSIINGEGEEKYPVSSFVLNCKGDACTGDVVMFEQNVYEMFSIASRSATGPPIGTRIVAGRIVKESYGAAKQQHTFTVEVLWSKGFKPLPPLHPLLIKGRNLYRLRTMRQRWDDEEERKKILQEKHSRGCVARSNRETRIQEKEMRKRGLRKGSKSFPDQKRLPQPNGRSSMQAWQENVQPEKQKKQDEPAHQKNEVTLFQELIRANPANPVLLAGVDMDKNIQPQPKIIKSSNSTIFANTVHGQRLTGTVGGEMHQKNSEIPNRQPLTNLNASFNLKHMQERGHPVGKLCRQEDIVQGMCLHSEDNLRRQEYFEPGRHHYEKSWQQDYYAQEKHQYKDKLQQQEYHVEDRHSHEYYGKYHREQGRHHYEKSRQQDYHAQEKRQYKDKLQQQEYHVEDRHSHEYYSKYHKEQGRHHYENSRQQEYHVEERRSHEYYSKYHKEQGMHHYENSRQQDYYAQEKRQYKDKLQQQEYHVEERHYNEYYSKYHKEFTCNYVNKKRRDQPPQQFCQFYAQGRCRYGDRCKYLHEKERFL